MKINNNNEKNKSLINLTDNPENNAFLNEDDNGSVLVIILQCETKSSDPNIINLKWAFSDPYFTVQVCSVDIPTEIPQIKTLSTTQYIENYIMREALIYASEGPYIPQTTSSKILEPQSWWNKTPVIIIKDSSVSNIAPMSQTLNKHPQNIMDEITGGMKRRIKTALEKASQADLFFLCKWQDACDKYTDVEGGNSIDHGSNLKWSTRPTATQAIMYTPKARDMIHDILTTSVISLSDILNLNILKGALSATVFVPNIIDFDIELATSNTDYNKLNECAPIQTTTDTSTTNGSAVWFCLVIIIMVLVAWFLIQLTPH